MGERVGARRRVPWLWPALRIVLVAVAAYLLLPQLAGLEATGRALARTTWWVPPAVLGLEAASLASYAQLLRQVLAAFGPRVPFGRVQRAVLGGYALGRTLPGGTAAALAVVTRALREDSDSPVQVTAGIAAAGLLSSLVLALLLPVGLVLELAAGHGGAGAVGAAVLLAAALAGIVAVARMAVRRPEAVGQRATRIAGVLLRGPLRRIEPERAGRAAERAVASLDRLLGDPRALGRAAVWAAANWLLDLAVLTLLAVTIGRGVPLAGLPLAYVLGQWVLAVPLTPGGVGTVEAAMTTALVAVGAPGGAAAATVLGWRLVSHWLPILVGLPLVPTLHRPASRAGRPRGRN